MQNMNTTQTIQMNQNNEMCYNKLENRLNGTINPYTIDSDDVVNTIDFRRKLLRFNQPTCGEDQAYSMYSIPRYYSEFRPWFHQCFATPQNDKRCISEYKRILINEPIYVKSTEIRDNNFHNEHLISIVAILFVCLICLFVL